MNADARNMLGIMVVAALVFLLALAARLGLVENESLLVACSGLADTACGTAIVAREAVVSSFVGGHLGWLAVVAAGVGLVAHWRPAAWRRRPGRHWKTSGPRCPRMASAWSRSSSAP